MRVKQVDRRQRAADSIGSEMAPCFDERAEPHAERRPYYQWEITLLLWHLNDRSDPEGSAFEDIWIDRFHTYLANPMTKLSL